MLKGTHFDLPKTNHLSLCCSHHPGKFKRPFGHQTQLSHKCPFVSDTVLILFTFNILLMEEILHHLTWYWNPANNEIFTISTSAGFLPSTVVLKSCKWSVSYYKYRSPIWVPFKTKHGMTWTMGHTNWFIHRDPGNGYQIRLGSIRIPIYRK